MKTIYAVVASFLILSVFGCDCGPGPGPAGGGQKVASLTIEPSQSTDVENGTLLIVKDKGTLLRVVGRDSDGAEVGLDPAMISWSSSDEAAIQTQPLGGSCIVKGLQDWFDTVAQGADPSTGREPAATLTVSYDGQSATLPAAIVLNANGKWQVQVTGGPLGTGTQDLDLVQHGRTLTHAETGVVAKIRGRTFTITQMGFTFTGDFSTRTTIEGTYADSLGAQGPWNAVKQ